MMRKISTVLLVILLIFVARFSTVLLAQESVGESSDNTDLGLPYNLECVTAEADIDDDTTSTVGTLTGTCSSPTGCTIAINEEFCTTGHREKDDEGKRHWVCDNTVIAWTTQNKELDAKYGFDDKAGEGGNLPRITIHGSANNTFPPGEFSVKATLSNLKTFGRESNNGFKIYALSEPQMMGTGGEDEVEGENVTQQLGTTKFEFPAPAGSVQKCVGTYWDPFGRVFDAVSLEPLDEGEARVTVLDDKDQYVNVPSNNVAIDQLGIYNIFLQKDGYYKIKADKMTNHDFVKVTPNPKYKDLYERIYLPGDPPFLEIASSPARIDIPVKPKSTPYIREVDTITASQNIIWIENEEYTKIEFRVTHPLTKIETNISGDEAFCLQTKKLLTDKNGFCTIVVRSSHIPQDGIVIKKVKNLDYYMSSKGSLLDRFARMILSLASRNTFAQTKIRIGDPTGAVKTVSDYDNITFSPILRHVEGYAYDKDNRPIANAKVEVVLVNSGKVFYTTKADIGAFFTIYKNNLPPLEYNIRFTDPTTSKTYIHTTEEFVESNKVYIGDQKLNMMAATKNNQPIVNPATGELNEIVKPSPANKNTSDQKASSNINIKMLSVFAIIFVLVISTIGVIVYIKQSHTKI